MFCPRCATENGLELAFCPQCGQALNDVRLALDGAPTESLQRLKSAARWMNGGIATLVVFILIATAITMLSIVLGHPVLSLIGMINVLLGAIIGIPLVVAGKYNVTHARRLLSSGAENKAATLDNSYSAQLPDNPNYGRLKQPDSITENTTINLKRSSVVGRPTKGFDSTSED